MIMEETCLSKRRSTSRGKEDSLMSLICKNLQETRIDDDFIKGVMADLMALNQEFKSLSREQSIKLVRNTLKNVLFGRNAEVAVIGEGKGRSEESSESDECHLSEVLEDRKEKAQESEDVTDHRGGRGIRQDNIEVQGRYSKENLTSDNPDSLASVFKHEEEILKGGKVTVDTIIIERVILEEIKNSRFYVQQDINNNQHTTTNIRLVREENTCKIFELKDDRENFIGRFHADKLTYIEDGFCVIFDPETSDEPDGGKRFKAKRRVKQKGQSVKIFVPADQQTKHQAVLRKMRKSLGGILTGSE